MIREPQYYICETCKKKNTRRHCASCYLRNKAAKRLPTVKQQAAEIRQILGWIGNYPIQGTVQKVES